MGCEGKDNGGEGRKSFQGCEDLAPRDKKRERGGKDVSKWGEEDMEGEKEMAH